MAVSPNGNFLACFTFDGKLRVLSTDFTKNLLEVDLHSEAPPAQLVWCGTDSVLLYWAEEGALAMVRGPLPGLLKVGLAVGLQGMVGDTRSQADSLYKCRT